MTTNSPTTKSKVLWTLFGAFLLLTMIYYSTRSSVKLIQGELNFGSMEKFSKHGDIAILEIQEVIMNPDEILEQIEELEENDSLKAVVVRISSPGGAVGPSQEILEAIKRLAQTKKVVCSLGDIAASGGLYIAMGCTKIVANPGTLTGSIGVIMHFMNLKNLYSWAKLDPYLIKAGAHKDIGSPLRPMTGDERDMIQKVVDQVHDQFQQAIADSRKLKREDLRKIADGRIFNGEQAKIYGLVDELGGEYEAIHLAAKLAEIKGKPEVVRAKNRHDRFGSIFEQFGASWISSAISSKLNEILPATMTGALKPGVPYFLPSFYVTQQQGSISHTKGSL